VSRAGHIEIFHARIAHNVAAGCARLTPEWGVDVRAIDETGDRLTDAHDRGVKFRPRVGHRYVLGGHSSDPNDVAAVEVVAAYPDRDDVVVAYRSGRIEESTRRVGAMRVKRSRSKAK
jgi:hypothetical protein